MGLLQGVYGAGRRLWNVLGTSRHLMTICTIAAASAPATRSGDNRVGMDPETLRFSKLIVLWGANVLTTNPHLWRSIRRRARRRRARRHRSRSGRARPRRATWHLAPIPGTDAALALGLLHVVLAEGKEDAEFIEGHTVAGRRSASASSSSRRRASPRSRACRRVDRRAGPALAATRPTGIRIGIGIQRHGGGGMAVRTISCMPGVTGDWRPGAAASATTRAASMD
jgi:anaerobic selenocysteine-containing dehydrogenase